MPTGDLSDYVGREQEYIKHCLLEDYIPPLAWKVGSAWGSLVYVDGFAGPWQTRREDHNDSSFGVAVAALRKTYLGLRDNGKAITVQSVLVDKQKEAFERLQIFAEKNSVPGFSVEPIHGEFSDKIDIINRIIREKTTNPFRFVFLDPKGWADIPIIPLKPLLKERSCEVLINLMTRHIIRFLDQDDRAPSFEKLFGRQGVLEKLKSSPTGDDERADCAVREYCKSLVEICNFKYVSQAVILDPEKESIRYFLVYGTNHPDGIKVFKEAEMRAARLQDEVRYESRVSASGQQEFLMSDGRASTKSIELRNRYSKRAKNKILTRLLRGNHGQKIPYSELFCEAMAFPLITPLDLECWLRSWEPAVAIMFENKRSKRPSPDKNDSIIVADEVSLRKLFSAANSDSFLL